MGENLAGKQLGGVDQANQWFLHTSGTALAGGARISNGSGEDTGLTLGPNWIAIEGSGGFRATLTFTGGVNKTFDLPSDGTGLVSNLGTGVTKASFLQALGITQKITTADVTNATTSAVDVTELNFLAEAGGIYRFEFLLRVESTNLATDVNLDLEGPAEADSVVGGIEFFKGSAPGGDNIESQAITGFPTAFEGATMDAVDTGQLVKVSGHLVMSGNVATSPLRIRLRAQNVSGTVKVMTGSALAIEKLN